MNTIRPAAAFPLPSITHRLGLQRQRTDLDLTTSSFLRLFGLSVCGALAGLAFPARMSAEPLFAIQEIIPPDGFEGFAYDLNNDAEATGSIHPIRESDRDVAFAYSRGRLTILGTFGGTSSWGSGINDKCEVVGTSTVSDPTRARAFIWSRGKMRNLGTVAGGRGAEGYDINNRGDVTGVAYCADSRPRAFIYSQGKMKVIEGLGQTSAGTAINDLGEVVGTAALGEGLAEHAFLSSKGTVIDLGTLGGRTSSATDINIWGDVVGTAMLAGEGQRKHAFLYSNGTMIDITPRISGGDTQANSINRWSQVVGVHLGGGLPYAFLYSGMAYNLNDLVVDPKGASLTFALTINDAGQILCVGTNSAGQTRNFFLTPLTLSRQGGK